jgi:hypothetical protein
MVVGPGKGRPTIMDMVLFGLAVGVKNFCWLIVFRGKLTKVLFQLTELSCTLATLPNVLTRIIFASGPGKKIKKT